MYYDSYNTALNIDTSKNVEIYHKSQLVIGVEKIPYPVVFGLFEKFSLDLGGTVGSLGTQEERSVFTHRKKNIKIAPVICFESLFGEFVSKYIQNGANLIFVITNDGWWDDTPGYRQHKSYSSLRAIETRRSIARSANTGTSCFVNQRGEISQPTQWWKEAVIRGNINANDKITFYVKFGDYIGRITSFISVLLILWFFAVKLQKKRL
jgi:apolipoprotein N-acyltransferase